jgi:lipopolysaccharide export system permease protein
VRTLQRYLVAQFLPVLAVALSFFVLILELIDLFANLWRYLSAGAPLASVLGVMALYAPKCVSYATPIAVLFASAYVMGNMYARNELSAVFSAGIPLHSLVAPLLALGLVFSLFMFFFEDRVVIHTLKAKNERVRELIKKGESLSNSNVVALSRDGDVVYAAEYYQDAEKRLFSLIVVVRENARDLTSVSLSPTATWDGSRWRLDQATTYLYAADGSVSVREGFSPDGLDEPPETFRRNVTSVDELSAGDAKRHIAAIRKAGLPYAEKLSNYYKRFSFPLTIFIVLFFSVSLGGRFKKNVTLMSLLLSLAVAVSYYVTQMVTMILAKSEYISPLAGAWIPVVLFIGISSVILRYART